MEAKKAAIEDFLRNNLCKGLVEKVCLEPDYTYMFLDLDRQVALGNSILNIPPRSLVTLDEYLEILFNGGYHVDGIEELEKALMKVQQNRDQIDIKLGVGLERIEADMTSLCNRINNRIADYFTDLIAKLQSIHLQNHKELLGRFDKLEQIMKKKIDLKASVNSGEEFNFSTFFNKFKMMQKEPEKLEKYLQSQIKRKIRYDAFAEEKDLKGFQDLYDEKSTFEENLINYVDNNKKLAHLPKQLQVDSEGLNVPTAVENALSAKIIQFIESTVGSATHFEQSTAQPDSARKSRAIAQDTLSRALQRANYVKSTKTPPQHNNSSNNSNSIAQLPSTSPFQHSSPRPSLSSDSIVQRQNHEQSQSRQLDGSGEPQGKADVLLLDNSHKLKAFLAAPEGAFYSEAVVRIGGREFTAANCERAARAVGLLEAVERLRVDISDVHGVPAGRLNKLRDAIVARSAGMRRFELILDRTKLNKLEINAFGSMLGKLEAVDHVVLSLEE
jgi:hypothetical protein